MALSLSVTLLGDRAFVLLSLGPGFKEVRKNALKLDPAPRWYWYMSGFGSAYQVTMNIFLTPELGFALFFLTVTLGQISSAIFLDHYAMFGFKHRPAGWEKLLSMFPFTNVLPHQHINTTHSKATL